MPNLRGSEWLIIILLVVLLFGAKRLPDAARSVGRSLRIFKAETKGLVEGETEPTTTTAPPAQPAAAQGELPGTSSTPPAEQPASQAQAQPPQQA
jgi:sec-independent protein translocase protein TatA